MGALHHICSWPPRAYINRSIIQVLWTPNQDLEFIICIVTRQKIRILITQPSAVVTFEQPKSGKITSYSNVYIRPGMFKEENWWRVYIIPWLSNGRKNFHIWYFKTESAKNNISESFLMELQAKGLRYQKRLLHRCFPLNFARFLRAHFFGTPLDDCL